jgi:hypothetical protein
MNRAVPFKSLCKTPGTIQNLTGICIHLKANLTLVYEGFCNHSFTSKDADAFLDAKKKLLWKFSCNPIRSNFWCSFSLLSGNPFPPQLNPRSKARRGRKKEMEPPAGAGKGTMAAASDN